MANVITGIRFACALCLIFCPAFSIPFYAVYIVGAISDVLDGIIARHFGKETKLGAQLDTIADIGFYIIVIVKVLRNIYIPMWLFIWIICIASIKCLNIFLGFILYKRFVAEHTVMNKICGVLLFLIPLCGGLISCGAVIILIILTCSVATFSAVQEGYYIRTGKEIH